MEDKYNYTQENIGESLFNSQPLERGFFESLEAERLRAKRYDTFLVTQDQDIFERREKDIIELAENTSKLINSNSDLARRYASVYKEKLTKNLPNSDEIAKDKIDTETDILPQDVLNGYTVSHMSPEELKRLGFGEDKEIYKKFASSLSEKTGTEISPAYVQALVFARLANDTERFSSYQYGQEGWFDTIKDGFLGAVGKQLGDLQAGTVNEHVWETAVDIGLISAFSLTEGGASSLLPEVAVSRAGATGIKGIFNLGKSGAGWLGRTSLKNLISLVPIDAVNEAISRAFPADRFGALSTQPEPFSLKKFAKEEVEGAIFGTAVEGGVRGAFKVKNLSSEYVKNVLKSGGWLQSRYGKSALSDSVLANVAKNTELSAENLNPKKSEVMQHYFKEGGLSNEEIFEKWKQEKKLDHDGTALGASNLYSDFFSDYNFNADELGKANRVEIDRKFIEKTIPGVTNEDINDILNNFSSLEIIKEAKRINPNVNTGDPFAIINAFTDDTSLYTINSNIIKSTMNMDTGYYKASEAEKGRMAEELLRDPQKIEEHFGRAVSKMNEAIVEENRKVGKEVHPDDLLKPDHLPQNWNVSNILNDNEKFVNQTFNSLDSPKMLQQKLERILEENLSDDQKALANRKLRDLNIDLRKGTTRTLAENPEIYKSIFEDDLGLTSLLEIRKLSNKITSENFKNLTDLRKAHVEERATQLKSARNLTGEILKTIRNGGTFDLSKLGYFARDYGVSDTNKVQRLGDFELENPFLEKSFNLISSLSKTPEEFKNIMEEMGLPAEMIGTLEKKYPVDPLVSVDDKTLFDSILRDHSRSVEDITKLKEQAFTEAEKGLRKSFDKDLNDIFKGKLEEGHRFYQAQKSFNSALNKYLDEEYKKRTAEALRKVDINFKNQLEDKKLLTGNFKTILKKIDTKLGLTDEEYADAGEHLQELKELFEDPSFKKTNRLVANLRKQKTLDEKIARGKINTKEMKAVSKKILDDINDQLSILNRDKEGNKREILILDRYKKRQKKIQKRPIITKEMQEEARQSLPETIENINIIEAQDTKFKTAKDQYQDAISLKKELRENFKKERNLVEKKLRKREVPANQFPVIKKEFSNIRRALNKEYKIESASLKAEINETFNPIIKEAKELRKSAENKFKSIRQKSSDLQKQVDREGVKAENTRDSERLNAIVEARKAQRVILKDTISSTKNLKKNKLLSSTIDILNNLIENKKIGYTKDDYYATIGALGSTELEEEAGTGASLFPKRHIHFAEHHDAIKALEEWGSIPLGTQMLTQMQNSLASKYAQLKYFGLPSEGDTFRMKGEKMKVDAMKLLNLSGKNPRSLNVLEKYKLQQLANNIDYVAGNGVAVNPSTHMLSMSLIGSLATASNLANLMKTIAFTDGIGLATQEFLLAEKGKGMQAFASSLAEYFSNLFKRLGNNKADAETFLFAHESYSRNFVDIAKMQLTNDRKSLSGLGKLTAKSINNINRYFEFSTQNSRLTANGQIIARRQLVDHISNPTQHLKDHFAKMHGILDTDWEYLSKNALRDQNGKVMLSSIADSYEGKRFLRAFEKEVRYMIPTHTQQFRASFKRPTNGFAVADFLLRNLCYLKGVPFIEMGDKLKNFMNTGFAGKNAIFFSGLVSSVLMTVVGNALLGKSTDLSNPEQWVDVVAKMPMTGVLGDVISAMNNPYYGNKFRASLLFGQYDVLADATMDGIPKILKGDFHTHDMMRLQRKLNPLAKTPLVGILYDRWLADNIIKTFDPKGYSYLRRISKMQKERGVQDF